MMHGSLPAKLQVLRARQGLTLIEAAEKLGIGRDTLSDLERGNRHPVMPTLAKIAKGYGVPVEDLLGEPVVLGKAEASATGPDGVVQADYPYPWMGDTLARTIDRWAAAVRDQLDPKYSNFIAVSCLDVLRFALRLDVPGDTLRDRVPDEEEFNQRV